MIYLLPAVTIAVIAFALYPMLKKGNPAAIRRRVYANLGVVCVAVVLTVGMSVSVLAQDAKDDTKSILLADSSEQSGEELTSEVEVPAYDPAEAVPSALATEEDKTNPETGALVHNEVETPALETAPVGAAQTNNGTGLGYLAAALCTGLSCIGAGIAIAATAPAAIGAFSENPKAFGKALIFVVLGEGVALYGVIISFLLMNKF